MNKAVNIAQHNLAYVYENGLGVAQDDVLAYLWWNVAAAKGDEIAANSRTKISTRMTSAQIDRAQELSRKCFAQNYKNCEK